MAGVLEHLNTIVQIDLNENPWDCACDLVPFKQVDRNHQAKSVWWVMSYAGALRTSPPACARLNWKFSAQECYTLHQLEHPQLSLEMLTLLGGPTSASPYEVLSPWGGPVPLSVLILSLLVLFFSAVFVAARPLCLCPPRRRKKLPFRSKRQEGVDLTGIQMQCHRLFEDGGGGGEVEMEVGSTNYFLPREAPPVGHVYEYIPHPVTQMCNNPIYKPREEEEVVVSSGPEAGVQNVGLL